MPGHTETGSDRAADNPAMPKKELLALALALPCLVAPGVFAQGSIDDARKGRHQGIVIWEPGQRAQATPPAPAAPGQDGVKAPAGTPASMNAAKSEPPGSSVLQRMFSTLRQSNPPSGAALNNAKALNAPGQGIPVPTAPAASATPR
jgi:hypothetical protein